MEKEKYKEILKAIMLVHNEKISKEYWFIGELNNLYIRIKQETGVEYKELSEYISTMWEKYYKEEKNER